METREVKKMLSTRGNPAKEVLTEDNFRSFIRILKDTFANLVFTESRLTRLYQQLEDYDAELVESAINKICQVQETLSNNTNLIALIKKNMGPKTAYRGKILGWECRDCGAAVPLEQDLCECMKGHKLTPEMRQECIASMRRLGLHKIADDLVKNWNLEGNFADNPVFYEGS